MFYWCLLTRFNIIILLMQFAIRRYFSSSHNSNLKTLLEKEVIPQRKESKSIHIQNLPPSEKNTEKKLSLRSKLTMPYSVWEDSPSCSMMAHSYIPWPESPSEDTPFLSFVKNLKRLLEELSLSPKSCSSYCSLVATLPTNNSLLFQTNGSIKAIWPNKKYTSSLTYLSTSILWPCYQWQFSTSKVIANSSKLTRKESINPSIGSTTLMTLWISWLNYHRLSPLSTDTSTTMDTWLDLITHLIGPATSHIWWASMISRWKNVSEDISRSTLITREETSQLIPVCL